MHDQADEAPSLAFFATLLLMFLAFEIAPAILATDGVRRVIVCAVGSSF